jgi:hypothetical protein
MEISRTSGARHVFFEDSDSDAPPQLELAQERPSATSSSDTDVYDVAAYCREKGIDVPKRRRQKKPAPSSWKRNLNKEARAQGKTYRSRGGQTVEKRSMGPPCIASNCPDVGNECRKISEYDRALLHHHFWSALDTWERRQDYVRTCSHLVGDGPRQVRDGPTRNRRRWILVLTNGRSYTVCRRLVASTLAIPEKTLNNWARQPIVQGPQEVRSKAAKQGKTAPISAEDKRFMKTFIDNIDTVPSHYCRNTKAYEDKKYLLPGVTVTSLHREYGKAAVRANRRAVSIATFSTAMEKGNYKRFRPKNDMCDTCISGGQGNISREELQRHRAAVTGAREEHNKDERESLSDPFVAVWTMDLQQVQLCPKTRASTSYYRSKLQVHNMTFFCKANKEGYCYIWPETEGDLSADVFASIQQIHFRRLITDGFLKDVGLIIIYSDGANYQNRCATIADAFLLMAKTYGITVIQKFLIKGHTQMECDSVHATIEKRTKSVDIAVPREFAMAARLARVNPRPYHVYQMKRTNFMRLTIPLLNSIRPGSRRGDPTTYDIRALRYSPDGSVHYKLDFDHEWTELPQSRDVVWETERDMVVMSENGRPITKKKYADLQALKSVLPQYAHVYYDQLPHEN